MKRESPFQLRPHRFALPELKTINKAAYWDYQRERVYVKSAKKVLLRTPADFDAAMKAEAKHHNRIPRSFVLPELQIKQSTAMAGEARPNRPSIYEVRHKTMDHALRHTSISMPIMWKHLQPSDRRWTPGKYGPDLIAYAMYQNIELGLRKIASLPASVSYSDLHLPHGSTNQNKAAAAQYYASTYDNLLKRLCSGRLLHVDETSVSVKGSNGYVWVLTSLEEVAYFYTPTREGNTIQAMLKDFSGVLVSDFYAAYDAIDCPQQKCLIHFIRDLNDAMLKHPYDDGLKRLVGDFTGLVKPMVETVDRRGLKKHFLGKHRISVDRFYKRLADSLITSEAAEKARRALAEKSQQDVHVPGF